MKYLQLNDSDITTYESCQGTTKAEPEENV